MLNKSLALRYFRVLRGPLLVGLLFVIGKATFLQMEAFDAKYGGTEDDGLKHLHRENGQTTPEKKPYEAPKRNSHLVIMFAYMRGGSSFLGATLEENPDVFYWYEPMWDVYNALTSSGMFQYPLHVVTDKDEKLRDLTKYETDFLREHMKNMFTCQFSQMPPEILSSWTLGKAPHSLGEYRDCLINGSAVDKSWGVCQKPLRSKCPNQVGPSLEQNCHMYMEQTRSMYGRDMAGFPPLKDYKKCMAPVITGIANCMDIITATCESRPYKGAKLLRTRMKFMREMFKDFPDMKVIHQLRDPRGTVTSRKKNQRSYRKDIVQEATLLCRKMVDDIKTRIDLEREFPGVFLVTKYEDLASRPVETVEQIYSHIDIPLKQSVKDWLKKSTSSDKDMGGFHLTRKNGTATANAWINKLSAAEKMDIDRVCKEVYDLVGYKV